MSSDERTSPKNGIWLCQNCAKLVDNDQHRYGAGVLEQWKSLSENTALLEVEAQSSPGTEPSDVELLRFFTQCLDRPAFQDPFQQEGSIEDFDRAIEDTIVALNTGCLRDRQGHVLSQAKGKAFLRRHGWRRQMDAVVDLLRAIRSRYDQALKTGEIHVNPQPGEREFYVFNNREVAVWMDETRAQVIALFSNLCVEAGLQGLQFPRRPWGHF